MYDPILQRIIENFGKYFMRHIFTLWTTKKNIDMECAINQLSSIGNKKIMLLILLKYYCEIMGKHVGL